MMFLNIDKDLKEELQKEAKEKGLSLTAYIRMLLIERGK
jgi:antitoxin component of RelBE/YafQ-DinJ toxin-antitoxin module